MAAMLQFMRMLTPCVLLIAGMAGPLPGAMAAVSPADKIKQWFSNFAVTKDDTGTEGLTNWPAMKLICIDDNLFRGGIPEIWQSDLCTRKTFIRVCAASIMVVCCCLCPAEGWQPELWLCRCQSSCTLCGAKQDSRAD
ncbi:hypothetical protein COO60DRAFT_649088 [Scenedesmus sp. NREL 46B-D3]|nr:hypothetical protein COO60DRAFT_649088 [Scenedesmus sp. NREL 46B-D3]